MRSHLGEIARSPAMARALAARLVWVAVRSLHLDLGAETSSLPGEAWLISPAVDEAGPMPARLSEDHERPGRVEQSCSAVGSDPASAIRRRSCEHALQGQGQRRYRRVGG